MAITHAKVSPKLDVADTDLVRPSDWNDAHVVQLDHAELSAVTPDQHHGKAHAHDGADGSGTVAGAALTGTPGGELGGTWPAPTVDPLHGGSTHAAVQAAAQATAAAALAAHAAAGDPHGGYATDADLAAHTGDTSDAHDASAVSSVPAGGLAASNVQAALNELDTEKVPTTRTLTAGAGLAGGGTLAANRTFDVNVDGSTLEISADALRVKDGGITTAKLAFNPATQAELDAHTASAVMDGDAAGGDLSGAYPNPSVVNDSHSHGSGTAPGAAHPSLATHDALGLATDAELAAHTADVVDAHDASAISFTPAGTIAATDVQAAIEEVAAEAGSGGGIDYVQVADPGAVGAGKLWLRLPQDAVPDSWAALEDTYGNQIAQPTTPNGHYYTVTIAGTTDTVEPTWPTDGSTFVDGTTEWIDSGLIGPIAVESLQLYRRNDADGDWVRVGVADVVNELVGLNAYGADGIQRASISVATNGFVMVVSDESGQSYSTIVVGDTTQMRKRQADGTNQIVGVASTGPVLYADGADAVLTMAVNGIFWTIRAGTADPSAGAGVVADIGSEYVRDNVGAGERWLKTGAADTDWTQLGAGGGGTPASTVTDETTFGIAPAVGADTEYARGDHTHGTPANPLAGSPETYTESNVTTDRAFNANLTTIDELADVLGSLIIDLRARGLVA